LSQRHRIITACFGKTNPIPPRCCTKNGRVPASCPEGSGTRLGTKKRIPFRTTFSVGNWVRSAKYAPSDLGFGVPWLPIPEMGDRWAGARIDVVELGGSWRSSGLCLVVEASGVNAGNTLLNNKIARHSRTSAKRGAVQRSICSFAVCSRSIRDSLRSGGGELVIAPMVGRRVRFLQPDGWGQR
jgi:hypothetical protein